MRAKFYPTRTIVLGAVMAALLGLTSGLRAAAAKEVAANDCLIGVLDESKMQLSGTVSCTDCDPTCDTDAVTTANGTCTFSIQGCLNIPGVAGCTLRPLKKFKFKTQKAKDLIKVTPTNPTEPTSVCGAFVNFDVGLKKKGKKAGKRKIIATAQADVKPAKQNKDQDKTTFVCNPRPAGEICPTTTTTTSTTTTTTMPCTPGCAPTGADFTNGAAGGTCGTTQDGSAATIANLTCGGLSIGGGGSIVPEGPTPDGSTNRYTIACVGSSCTVGPTNTAGPEPGVECTNTGCNFGTPLPIPNPVLPTLTTCVQNTWAMPASGTLDTATGVASLNVPLTSDVYLTGNLLQPCPLCSATGTPSNPGTGTCDRGPNAAGACTSTNSVGLTNDCPTGGTDGTHPCNPGGGACIDGSHVGPIGVDLSPLTTGSSSLADVGGLFCPSQSGAGCFGSAACRTITENGTPFGAMSIGVAATGTLASTFCIAATGNGLVDASANLPGPGAVSLPGDFALTAGCVPCP